MDDLSGLFNLAVEVYGETIEDIGKHFPDSNKPLREEYRKKLKQIRGALLVTPDRQTITETRKRLDAELQAHGKTLGEHVHQQESDVKQIMGMIASMADSMATREKQHNVRFKGIAKQLRLLTTAQDLGEIRQKLAAEIDQLEKYVEEMARDTQEALDRVQTDLRSREKKERTQCWLEPGLDPVTQIAGRPDAIKYLAQVKRTDMRFCIGRFSVTGYKPLFEKQGAVVVNSILQEIAFRLKDLFKDAALVARWSDADFLVVVDSPLTDLAVRISEVERKLSLTFTVPGRGDRIVVSVHGSAVQSLRTETAEEMVKRVMVGLELTTTK